MGLFFTLVCVFFYGFYVVVLVEVTINDYATYFGCISVKITTTDFSNKIFMKISISCYLGERIRIQTIKFIKFSIEIIQ